MTFMCAVYFKLILLFVVIETFFVSLCYSDCVLLEKAQKHEEKLLHMLEPLKGHQFEVTEGNYTYHVKICDKVDAQKENVGAVQYIKNNKDVSLGRFDQADISGGSNWVLLTYHKGEEYQKHCNGTDRITQIMITCDPDHLKGEFRMLEEKRKSFSWFCFYMFELGSSAVCVKDDDKPKSLSSGAVFCIIFITFFAAYIILGFLYKKLVVGAKGLEQIPNYSFWREFGNLQADACDYVCRCGPRQESHAYRGIDDRLKDEDERDEQLLNM